MADERVSILAILEDQVSKPLKKVENGFKAFDERLGLLAKNLKKAGTAIQGLGRDLTPLSAVFAGVGIAAGKFAADFDKAITKSTAIIGGLTDALDKDLRDAAKRVARDVPFSAAQVAESFFFLASAGLDAQQSIAALDQVTKFAIAGQFDLADATDLSTDALTALGLAFETTAEVEESLARVTDVLVKANTLANASVRQFSEALTNRAGTALRQTNKDIEEGVAALAVFADQGVKGALAGQQLFQVLRNLQKAAQANTEAFEQFNIRVFEGGEVRNLADIIEDLETAFGKLDTEQRRAALTTLGFEERALGALQTLIGFSGQIRDYEGALRTAQGTTQRVADFQIKNLSDAFAILRGRFEEVAIELGEALIPFFTRLVEVGTETAAAALELVAAFKNLDEETRAIIGGVGLFVAALGPLIFAFGIFVRALGSAVTALRVLIFVVSASPFGILLAAVAAVTAGIKLYEESLKNAARSTKDLRTEQEKLADVVEEVEKNVTATERDLEAVRSKIREVQKEVDRFSDEDLTQKILNPDGTITTISALAEVREEMRKLREEEARLEAQLEAGQDTLSFTEVDVAAQKVFQDLSDSLAKTTTRFEVQRRVVSETEAELDRAERQLQAFTKALDDMIDLGLDPTDARLQGVAQQVTNLATETEKLRKRQADLASESENVTSKLQQQQLTTRLLADAQKLLEVAGPGTTLTGIQAFATKATEALAAARAEIQQLVDAGLITTAEAFQRNADAVAEFELKLNQAVDALLTFNEENLEIIAANPELLDAIIALGAELDALRQRLNDTSEDRDNFFAGFGQGAISAAASFNTIQKAGQALGSFFATELTQGLVDVFVEGKKSFDEFLTDFLKGIAAMIVQILILNAISAAFGGQNIFGIGAAANTGGMIARGGGVLFANTGRLVPGSGPNRDTVPAMLTPGEYVHNRSATQYYGPGVMRAINRRLIPREALMAYAGGGVRSALRGRFQTGGEVGSGGDQNTNGRSTEPAPAFLVADEQTADRLFAGGPQATRRMLESQADVIRGIVGGRVT